MLLIKARLDWHAAEVILTDGGLPVSMDSAASGGVKDGFGLRSTYLPGPRRFTATPTIQSCCMEPNSRGEYPNALRFPVAGFTVAPTVRPQDLTLEVLQSNLEQACGTQHWITAGAVCGSLRSKLEQAINAQKRGDHDSAKGSLRSFVEDLDAQYGLRKPVSDNAYWLLKVNGEYLFAHM